VTQIGRLINSLEKEGYLFLHERRDGERFVTYVLVAEPEGAAEPRQIAKASGWRSQGFSFGRPENRPKPPVSVPRQEMLFGELTASGGVRRFLDYESGKKNW
jgi:hypothetical protein